MHIRPLLQKDIPYLADLTSLAFLHDSGYDFVFPDRHLRFTAFRLWHLHMWRITFATENIGRCFVAVEPDPDRPRCERMLGAALWERIGSDTGSATAQAWRQTPSYLKAFLELQLRSLEGAYLLQTGLTGAIRQRINKFQENASIIKERLLPHIKDAWWLEVLAVLPSQQGRGIGSMLLQWGIDRATEEHIPIMLISSGAGAMLYAHKGFKVFDWSNMEYREREGSAMVRENWDDDGFGTYFRPVTRGTTECFVWRRETYLPIEVTMKDTES